MTCKVAAQPCASTILHITIFGVELDSAHDAWPCAGLLQADEAGKTSHHNTISLHVIYSHTPSTLYVFLLFIGVSVVLPWPVMLCSQVQQNPFASGLWIGTLSPPVPPLQHT